MNILAFNYLPVTLTKTSRSIDQVMKKIIDVLKIPLVLVSILIGFELIFIGLDELLRGNFLFFIPFSLIGSNFAFCQAYWLYKSSPSRIFSEEGIFRQMSMPKGFFDFNREIVKWIRNLLQK